MSIDRESLIQEIRLGIGPGSTTERKDALLVKALYALQEETPTRKRRSDAGIPRQRDIETPRALLNSAPNAAQESLTGFPDEDQVQ